MLKKSNLFGIIMCIFLAGAVLVSGCAGNGAEKPGDTADDMAGFNQCLSENGVVIYGTEWCPACSSLIESLGGYESAGPVYVECADPENEQRCREEMKGNAVPEIQINDELYEGQNTPEGLSEATGCQIPN